MQHCIFVKNCRVNFNCMITVMKRERESMKKLQEDSTPYNSIDYNTGMSQYLALKSKKKKEKNTN